MVKSTITFLSVLIAILSSCATSPDAAPELKIPKQETPVKTEEISHSEEKPEKSEDVPLLEKRPAKSGDISNTEEKPEKSEEISQAEDWPLILGAYAPSPTMRKIELRVFPQDALVQVLHEGALQNLEARGRDRDRSLYLTDAGAVLLEAPGHETQLLPLALAIESFETKLERPSEVIRKIAEVPTGHQPKSVRFSPDGEYLYVANLGDFPAIGVFRTEPLEWVRNLEVPEEYRRASGFVETAILEKHREIWLSQMNRDTVHVFDMDSGRHLAAIRVSGRWPKVLLPSEDESRMYVSCWEGGGVIEIDVPGRKETRAFRVDGTPRGLAFAEGGKQILATRYAGSGVDRIDLENGRVIASTEAAPGRNWAFRHIVHDEKRGEYYITAMGKSAVYRLSEDGQWLSSWDVANKPNTCEISPDGRYLFVSCRGPNNPDSGYLQRGYEYGKVYIINLESSSVEGWIWGRDQCTGLDVSPDGKFLAFTDFLSHNLELYEIF